MKAHSTSESQSVFSIKQILPNIAEIIRLMYDKPIVTFPPGSDTVRVEFGENGEPVRNASDKSKSTVHGYIMSEKNVCMVAFESPIEKQGFLNLESSPLVKSYRGQPARIYYLMDGAERLHIPDCFAELTNGKKCFIEFKDNSYLDDPELLARTRFLASNLPFIGYSYVVIIKDQISDTVADNVTKLYRMARSKVTIEKILVFKRIFDLFLKITLRDLMDLASVAGLTKADLYVLILSGQIKFDWHYPLSDDTQLVWGA